jgi:uncharacterized membrane protein YeaQ/YmgE (transglycosylase-associated protein family)
MKGGLTLNLMLLMFCLLFAIRYMGGEAAQFGIEYIATFNFASDGFFLSMLLGIGGAFVGAAAGAIWSRLAAGSYSVMYIIPAIAFGWLAATLISPVGFILNAGVPEFVKVFLMGIIYMMMLAIGYGFIRGMEV